MIRELELGFKRGAFPHLPRATLSVSFDEGCLFMTCYLHAEMEHPVLVLDQYGRFKFKGDNSSVHGFFNDVFRVDMKFPRGANQGFFEELCCLATMLTWLLPSLHQHACPNARHKLEMKKLKEELRFRNMKIYLMKHKNGLVKIGASINPKSREKTLQAEDPNLEIFFEAPGSFELERKLHLRFSEQRVRGEWFNLKENDVEWIVDHLQSHRRRRPSLARRNAKVKP
jgi:hypothetical protein